MPCCGPGYKSPVEAIKGPRETILYTLCIQPDKTKQDYLATIDVDPQSPTYSQVIHRMKATYNGDEMHHFGWNACSSCHSDSTKKRNRIVIPCLGSDRIYIVDTTDEKQPKLHKVIEPEEVHALGVGTPHTTHCLPSGEVMISMLGDENEEAKCDFLLIDSQTWKPKGLWIQGGERPSFGYDFWYQPYWDIMVSSEWAQPKSFKSGFHPSLDPKISGRSLNLFSWKERKLIKSFNLGTKGLFPLEVRFLHDPKASVAFVGAAYDSNIYRVYRDESGEWNAEVVIHVEHKKVSGWKTHLLTGMITDILISLDDRYLYLSNWFHGDVRQYDITDTAHPKLVGQIYLGGLLVKGSHVISDEEEPVEPVVLKERQVYGGPQMLQLSLDGKRLYVTNSLFSKWDNDVYPDMIKNGSALLKVNVDNEKGGLTLDRDFVVHFGLEPDGPVLAHECRYPGGDCTSDIWLPCQDETESTETKSYCSVG